MKAYIGGRVSYLIWALIIKRNHLRRKGNERLSGSGKSLSKGPGVGGSMVSSRDWKMDSMSEAERTSGLMAKEKAVTCRECEFL